MSYPLVSVLIVTYNSEGYIEKCLKSIQKITYPNLEVIVIDNNSTDKTPSLLKKFKFVQTIYQTDNTGFATGNNIGASHAKGKYILLLNPDTETDKNFLQPLVECISKSSKIGAVQPMIKLMHPTSKINCTGKITHFLGFDWIRDYLKTKPSVDGEIDSFSGAAILIDKNLFTKSGGFDDYYFMYFEDSDMSWRMRLFGYKIMFTGDSVIYHDYKYVPVKSYQSMKSKLYFNERNRLINIIKNYQLISLFLLSPAIILIEVSMIVYAILSGWGIEKFKAYQSIIKLVPQILERRNFVQANRRVSDAEVTKNFASQIDFVNFRHPVVTFIINPVLTIYWLFIRNFLPQ